MIAPTPAALQATEAAVVTAGTASYPDITWLDEALRGLVRRLAEQPDTYEVLLRRQRRLDSAS